jgi:hypothetical protein
MLCVVNRAVSFTTIHQDQSVQLCSVLDSLAVDSTQPITHIPGAPAVSSCVVLLWPEMAWTVH